MKRKEFIRLSASAIILLANGNVVKANDFIEDEKAKKKIKLRFAVASDGHYGEPKTDYENYFATVVSGINAEHKDHPFSFSVINGDIVHDDKTHYPAAKKALDNLINITGISSAEMSAIMRTSERTLRRYSPKQKLNAEQSERVIELAKIYSRGEQVFGTLDAFKEWMNGSVMALGNKKPKEFLDTSMGIEMLMDELGRIEHGIFA